MLLRGVNDAEAADLLRWCLERGYALRFIEQMPLDAQHGWDRDVMVTAAEILAMLRQQFTLTPHGTPRGAAPAELFDVDDFGQAVVIGDGRVPPELEEKARLAVANCPEYAITLEEDA